MRTETPWFPASTVARVRAELGRARRRFASRPAALRWSAVAAALAAAVALAYLASGPTTSVGGFVRSGEKFSSDDLISVRNALDAKHIPYRVDGPGRVEVAADRLDDANDVVAKLDVGRHTIAEIERRGAESSPWDSPGDKERRREQAVNAELGAMIQRMGGIVAAHVKVNPVKSRGLGRPSASATAFVYLETEDGREVSGDTVEKIQALIGGAAPMVKPDAVTVFDSTGRPYSNAHNPTVGRQAKTRARREELRQEIVAKLDWLKGVQVSVQLVPAAAPSPLPPLPVPRPVPPPAPAPEDLRLPAPSVGVNEPLELTPDEPPPAAPRPAPAAPTAAAEPGPPAAEPSAPHKARVWVKVPRSFYIKALGRREPSLDDLQTLVERQRLLIETAVKHVVPPGEFDEVVVSTIPDDLPAREEPPPASTSADARRSPSWWVPAGVACGATAALMAVGFGVLAARRPSLRAAVSPGGGVGRYKIDEASGAGDGPGPSERVRELIRLNPEAAASVLHRWTGQGGTIG